VVSIRSVTDEELVLLAQQGDTSAFDQLVIRHEGSVYRAALAALRAPEDAKDVAQDAFVIAWSKLRRFRGDSSFKTWLLTITWNRAINHRRMQLKWWRRSSVSDVRLVAAGEAPDTDLRTRRLRRDIEQAIEALTPKLRDAFLLVQSEEYEYKNIAAMLGISEGTVKWRVSEARRQIKEQLAELGYLDAR